jgi:hypothetical protein
MLAAASSALLLDLIEQQSRVIDDYCRRHFYVKTETRYYTPASAELVYVKDMLAITELATDSDDDNTYPTIWAATDYVAEPRNEYPIMKIHQARNGRYDFPMLQDGIRITGTCGYGDGTADPWTAATTTGTIATTNGTTLTLSSASAIVAGQTIKIESEQMYVSAVSTSATVVRGVNGTTAAAHTGAAVYTSHVPECIRLACIQLSLDAYEDAQRDMSIDSEMIGQGNYQWRKLTPERMARRFDQMLSRYVCR